MIDVSQITSQQRAILCDGAEAEARDLWALEKMGVIRVGKRGWWLTIEGDDVVKMMKEAVSND